MRHNTIIKYSAIGGFIFTLFFVGCGENTEQKQQQKIEQAKKKADIFSFIEDQRNIAKENGQTVAADYRSENPRLTGMKIVSHTDSSISPECPSGDGWVSISLMATPSGKFDRNTEVEKIKLKCSSVSLSLGCYLEDDFTTKPFAKEDGKCNPNLPSPLPKVAQ